MIVRVAPVIDGNPRMMIETAPVTDECLAGESGSVDDNSSSSRGLVKSLTFPTEAPPSQ